MKRVLFAFSIFIVAIVVLFAFLSVAVNNKSSGTTKQIATIVASDATISPIINVADQTTGFSSINNLSCTTPNFQHGGLMLTEKAISFISTTDVTLRKDSKSDMLQNQILPVVNGHKVSKIGRPLKIKPIAFELAMINKADIIDVGYQQLIE